MNKVAYAETARSQLTRLATLTDVVYAGALVLIIFWLPRPDESLSSGEVWLLDLFAEHAQNLIAIIIGLVFIIMYWLRSNTLLSALDRTDGAHTALSIASVFFLLLLLYMVAVSEEVTAASRRAGESGAVALIGLAAGAAWWWAGRKGLVRDGITSEERLKVQLEAFSEPLAALVTLPFAFVGELWWNLSWLAYLPISALLRRRGVKQEQS
jgi:uncharacterized membrane protein